MWLQSMQSYGAVSITFCNSSRNVIELFAMYSLEFNFMRSRSRNHFNAVLLLPMLEIISISLALVPPAETYHIALNQQGNFLYCVP